MSAEHPSVIFSVKELLTRVDDRLASIDTKLDAKADKADLAALVLTLDAKASKADMDALRDDVDQIKEWRHQLRGVAIGIGVGGFTAGAAGGGALMHLLGGGL
ncbi:MAG: hypothetical protein ACXIVQ_12300 [Acidimicrobiales bacterium]